MYFLILHLCPVSTRNLNTVKIKSDLTDTLTQITDDHLSAYPSGHVLFT